MNNSSKQNPRTKVICSIAYSLIVFTTCSQTNSKNEKAPVFSLDKILDLPAKAIESSGIIFYDSLLWTFNDGGHDPVLFGIDIRSGEIKNEIFLQDARNVDWEDIAQDASSIYIGDIGNNWGNRKDLCVYKLSKSGINGKKKKDIKVHKISYSYPDQNNFSYKYDDSPYDCEALVCTGDSLLLFTKNWKTHHSVVYSIPVYPGDYIAHKIATIDSKGLVTGADYDTDTERLAICGHKNHIPFVMIFNLKDITDLQKKDFKRFELNNLYGVQIEGIVFHNNSIYLSSEKSFAMPALFRMDIN